MMIGYEEPPDIIIHIEGNDVGKIRLGYLQYQLKQIWIWIWEKLPKSIMVCVFLTFTEE